MTQENAATERTIIETIALVTHIEVKQAKLAVNMLKDNGYRLIDPEKLTVLGDEEIATMWHQDFDNIPDVIFQPPFYKKIVQAQLAHTRKELEEMGK